METILTKNGFVLPIFSDEVVTKQLEEGETVEEVEPPKVGKPNSIYPLLLT